jgi:hypothetical protein
MSPPSACKILRQRCLRPLNPKARFFNPARYDEEEKRLRMKEASNPKSLVPVIEPSQADEGYYRRLQAPHRAADASQVRFLMIFYGRGVTNVI